MIVNGLIFLCLTGLFGVVDAKPVITESVQNSEFISTTATVNPIVEQAQQKISHIINSDLSWRERNSQIDQIYATLPPHLLPNMPLDGDFNRLPTDVYKRINSIHLNEKIRLRDRRARIRKILDSLTWSIRTAMEKEEFPLHPPAGFEDVLGPQLYRKLLAVHTNLKMSVNEKKENIDQIMSQVPNEILEKLPLPQPMGKLPDTIQKNIRKIIYTFQTKWDERLRQLRQYVRTLPKSYRRMLRQGWIKIDEVSKEGAKTDQKKVEEIIGNLPLKVEETTEIVPVKVEIITPKMGEVTPAIILKVEGITQKVPLPVESTTQATS